MTRRQRRAAGFTLLELLVCLALVSLLAMLSLPLLGRQGNAMQLAADGRVLSALLREARERALAGREPVAVRIDLAARRVAIEGEVASHQLSAVQRLQVITARGEAEGPEATILFQPDGGSSGALIVMRADGATRRLAVDWLSGAIVQEGR